MRSRSHFFKLSQLGLLALLSSQVYASGFKLEFQSPSVLADAGDAAVVEDAGTNWYNSAGLVYIPQQLAASMIDVYSATTFSGNTAAPSIFGSPFAASGRVSAHNNSFLPALHYAMPLALPATSTHWAFGISMVPAWGLMEDYGEYSLLRYTLTRVYTRTIDIAPSIAAQINNQWSIGFGPDFHYFTVQSKAHSRTQFATPTDSIARFSADDWAYGGHVGVLYRFSDATRIGLNYRSKIVMNLTGYSDFASNGLGTYETNAFKLQIPLPPTTSLSFYHDMTPTWALMGTLAFDQWSVLKNFHGQNVQSIGVVIPSLVQPLNLRNTVDIGVGTHYVLNDRTMLRASIKYEPTPTRDAYRDVNFPDAEKLGLNLGMHYQYNKALGLDAIIAHVFTKSEPINSVNPLTLASATGRVNTNIDLIGAQVVWTMC